MPKKKGSKKAKGKSKKANLTPEEMQILEDQKRMNQQKDNEMRTAMTIQFLREKLEEEQHNTAISRRKVSRRDASDPCRAWAAF